VSDVERYAQLIGATPGIGPDGWFLGASDEQRAVSRLTRFITKVWVYEHPVPDTADELQRLDPGAWHAALTAYEAAGGTAHRGTEGATLFETWAAHQLSEKRRYSVLLSESAATLPIDDIPRVALLTPSELAGLLGDVLPIRDPAAPDRESEAPALMSLGRAGHVIRLRSRSATLDAIYYFDPWPGPSLLCDANNEIGVRAQLVQREPLRWSLTRAEFERAACALVIPTRSLTWTRYGEPLRSYAELKQTDLFGRFRLREAEPFRATEILRVQPCTTRAGGHDVLVEIFLDDDGVVRLARVSSDPALARPGGPLADLIGYLVRALEASPGRGADRAALRQRIGEVIQSGRPGMHVGATVVATLGLLTTKDGPRMFAEILPA
jgi:hypothetical protein